MIGLALSGGGSRAIAFHLGCLRALNDLEILDRVGVLSTISGGSIIGAYYAYTPEKTFDEFEADVRLILRKGFQHKIALELIKPYNLIPCAASFGVAWAHEAITLFFKKEWCFQRYPTRSDMFHRVLRKDVFHKLIMTSPRRNGGMLTLVETLMWKKGRVLLK